ncbi:MAG: hypothetical protein AAGJ40_08830 [Planctomycetota bacterium]
MPNSSDSTASDEDAIFASDADQSTPSPNEDFDQVEAPFLGQWTRLISTTNWEKGRIIHSWREALIAAGAPSSEFSDEAWSVRVGGVTAAHVGRLRRVFVRFGDQYKTYEGLYWTHFLAAMEWDDAALWLQGAVEESWSVASMREQRWQASGARESDRPIGSQIVEVELDEDVPNLGTTPAQGDGNRREFDGDESGVAAGPAYEPPDFGDADELNSMAGGSASSGGADPVDSLETPVNTQPFAGLPQLPDDLNDAIESLKLSILRHKADGYRNVDAATIHRYLDAVATLIAS